jgi:hypothetical protein
MQAGCHDRVAFSPIAATRRIGPPAHRPLRGLLGVNLRHGLRPCAVTNPLRANRRLQPLCRFTHADLSIETVDADECVDPVAVHWLDRPTDLNGGDES